jgi:hypothetical protein
MGGFGSFYKGEKKKPKKKGSDKGQVYSDAPTYKMPEIIIKKKKYS